MGISPWVSMGIDLSDDRRDSHNHVDAENHYRGQRIRRGQVRARSDTYRRRRRHGRGRSSLFGLAVKFQADPHWRNLILFHDYFSTGTAVTRP